MKSEGSLHPFGDSITHFCLGQSKCEVCKPAVRVGVFRGGSQDTCGLEGKQEGIAPLNCLYPLPYSVLFIVLQHSLLNKFSTNASFFSPSRACTNYVRFWRDHGGRADGPTVLL